LKWYVSLLLNLQLLRWLTVKEHFKMGNNKQKKNEAAEPATSPSTKMSGKDFEKKLAKLQVELVRLQTWVQAKKARVIVVFEGRDTAGKGGVISRITERTSPRVFRHVALPTPSDRQKSQVYMQRYMAQFPAAGEIILFDRSWYNRAGVERVMGFCTDEQYERFLELAPVVEREIIVKNGIILRKYFLDVSQDEQRRRFAARIDDPLKHWKLSPMDTESVRRWWDYTAAYQRMIKATHTPEAPWYIVPADNKRHARLNLIRHLLDSIPYKKVDIDLPKIPRHSRGPRVLPRVWAAKRSPIITDQGGTVPIDGGFPVCFLGRGFCNGRNKQTLRRSSTR
jgi:polyphosphate kinase